jgi:aspartate 1-decarboxylase
MMFKMLYSKLHRAHVTHTELHYNGSLGVDRDLMDAAGLVVGQQIDVVNVANGKRFTTYVIEEPRGSRRVGVYGAAAHLAHPKDIVIIICYALMDEKESKTYTPRIVILDEKNNPVENG